MHPTVVLNVVGLTQNLVGAATPNLAAFARAGGMRPLATVLPAVTCTVQSSMVTGALPREHGAVANGWYFRDLAEIWFWRQSNHLIGGEKIWEAAARRDPAFTCAKLFWWYNMYSNATWSVTPRPLYPADGLKLPDVYSTPIDLRDELQGKLGTFPLFSFWGPATDISATRWIADSARHVYDTRRPTLTLVYLPHLDYVLQRLGPNDPRVATDLAEIDAVCGELIEHCRRDGARVIVLSEYGITEVRRPSTEPRAPRGRPPRDQARARDRHARPRSVEAFAVADHQLAHVYVRRPERIRRCSASSPDSTASSACSTPRARAAGLDHPRSGELVAVSAADRWFSYYFWLDDARAPDYARTVDIHRKPGYDPVELFLDPALWLPQVKVGWTLAKKAAGFRYLMDVIPLDTRLVRGSHGRVTDDLAAGPLFMSSEPDLVPAAVAATDVKEVVLAHVFGPPSA